VSVCNVDVEDEPRVEATHLPAKSEPAPSRPASRSGRNVVWNWCGILTESSVGFVLAPFLIRSLGDDVYGLWILIGAFTGYFGMLDLGLRGAVGRFIALHSAKGDQHGVKVTVSTAAAALLGIGALSFAAIVGCSPLLQFIFDIPANQLANVQTALIIVGFQLALWLVLRIFDAALWARQRFDLLNCIDIPMAIARAALTWHFISHGGGLVALAWISLAMIVANGCLKCFLTFREMPYLQISWRYVQRPALRELYGYGVWNSLVSFMGMARSQGMPVVVGSAVGMQFLSPFSVVMRLPALANAILGAATGVFTPVAVRHHALGDAEARRRMVVEGTRLSLSLALFFATLFIFLGKPLLAIWIRPDFAAYGNILAIVGCGEILPMAMSIPMGVLQAMALHQRTAKIVVVETLMVLIGSALLGSMLGILGVAIALAVFATLFRGLLIMRQICEVTALPWLKFARQTMIAPLCVALLTGLLLFGAVEFHQPQRWASLVGYTFAFTGVYAIAAGLVVLESRRRIQLWNMTPASTWR
jgi:O-antigen/teichoic acid export membrane protein